MQIQVIGKTVKDREYSGTPSGGPSGGHDGGHNGGYSGTLCRLQSVQMRHLVSR